MDVRRFVSQTNRYTQALRKLLAAKGEQGDPSFGIHLEDERPEHSFIKGERRWGQFNAATSAVGTKSFVGITNAPSSGILTVVTNCFLELATAAVLDLAIEYAIAVNGQGGVHAMDTRWGTLPCTTNWIAGASAGGPGGGTILAQLHIPANAVVDLMALPARVPPIVLGPGTQMWVEADAVGVNTLAASFFGYERSLESGELIPA